jgi:hypothetical protein
MACCRGLGTVVVVLWTTLAWTDTTVANDVVPCGIWLAPSTIPGAGLGMYAGRDFEEGESLQQNHLGEAVGDPVIPIVDHGSHNIRIGGSKGMLWDEYTWS